MAKVNLTAKEEWAAWANSLKPGDKVIVEAWGTIVVDAVRRVTPSGWVVTENYGTYSQSKYADKYSQRGGYYGIVPITEELEKRALEEMAEREKKRKIERAIRAAKSVTYEWSCGKREIDFNLAIKILELSGEEFEK